MLLIVAKDFVVVRPNFLTDENDVPKINSYSVPFFNQLMTEQFMYP